MTAGTYSTSMSYDQAYNRIVTDLTVKGAVIEQTQPTLISGHILYHKRPSIVLGLILCLFFLVPGIIYFVVAGKDKRETFAVEIGQSPGEPTTMRLHGSGRGAYAAMRTMEMLP